MNSPKLSICIPTYNREKFIEKLLGHLKADLKLPFSYEIVVSDNGSPDNTQAVVQTFINDGMPIRYFRRNENAGGWPNLANAFFHANGEYALYLADDDLLIPAGLIEAVNYLDANSDVVACYAPWTLYDEVAEKDTSQFYSVASDTKYANREFETLFNFIFEGHVFPEIGVYRSSALRSVYVPREFCFWAFSYLTHFLDIGSVSFLKKPFYRSVTRSKIEREGVQAGFDEVATAWDRYRGGLEYLIYVAAKRSWFKFSPDQSVRYEKMCRVFTLNRMAVALRFWMAREDYIKAYELYTRLMLGGLVQHPDVKQAREKLPLMVAVQTFSRQVNALVGVSQVVLFDVADAVGLDQLFHKVGLRNDIKVVAETDPLASGMDPQSTVIFTAKSSRRSEFLARGYLPNMVFCEDDLTARTVF